jgi:hypothetical protein
MSNVLSEEKKQQVIALGKLGWSLRRIEESDPVPGFKSRWTAPLRCAVSKASAICAPYFKTCSQVNDLDKALGTKRLTTSIRSGTRRRSETLILPAIATDAEGVTALGDTQWTGKDSR